MAAILELLDAVPFAGLMLAVTLGFLLGRPSWRGFSLGGAGGTLLVAMMLGRLGVSSGAASEAASGADAAAAVSLGTFGFALFIYSVGFEAGPRFFSTFGGGKGWRFAVVGVTVNVLAVGVAVLCGRAFDLDGSVAAGLLAGAITSVPTYAAAVEKAGDAAVLAVSFVCSYPVGLIGVALLVQFLPRWMHDDLDGEHEEDEDSLRDPHGPELRRAFEVRGEEVVGKSLAELDLNHRTGCYVTRVHRGAAVFFPDAETRLEAGDRVMAKGRLDELRVFEDLVGPEVYDEDLRSRLPAPRPVRVAYADAEGRTLAELDLLRKYHCLVVEVVRGGVVLEPAAELRLHRGDIARVVGRPRDLRAVAAELGHFERSNQETDIAIYAAGILLGFLLGKLTFPGSSFALGPAVGLLTTGVLLGRLRRIGPFSAHVPAPARQLVRDLGILLFVAETGLRAGASPLTGMEGLFWPALASCMAITVLPMVGALLLGRYALGLRPLDAWGSICGGMTSSAALVTLRQAADSNEPAISYAAAYAVASVLATLAGQVVIALL